MPKTKRKAAADAAKEAAVSAAERAAEPSGEDDDGDRSSWPEVHDGWYAPMVYPKGSLRLGSDREKLLISEDQWTSAVQLLEQGFVVAFSTGDADAPDFACELAQRCRHFRIGAAYERDHDSFSTVFFAKIDDGAAVPPKRRKTEPGTKLQVY